MTSNISYRSGSDPDPIRIRSESNPVRSDQIFSDSDSGSNLYMKSESDPRIINCIIDPDLTVRTQIGSNRIGYLQNPSWVNRLTRSDTFFGSGRIGSTD